MNVRSPTATLDAGWDSLLTQPVPAARAVDPLPEYAETLADIVYFYEQGLVDDAEIMFEDLRRRNPDEPMLAVAPWKRAESEPAATPSESDEWVPDERDILEALDMLEDYDNERDPKLAVVDAATDEAESSGFHEAITIVESPLDLDRPEPVTGTVTYPIEPMPEEVGPPILADLDDPELAAAWFDGALRQLAALEAPTRPATDLEDDWDVDLVVEESADDGLDGDEVDIDTAEFEAPPPSVFETLTYLPRNLAEMRQTVGSVYDTMPYTDEDRPRPLTLIPGGK